MKTRPTIIGPSATGWLAAAIWLAVIVATMSWIAAYSNSPGVAGQAPGVWPGQSRLARVAGHPTLVMFVHPHCPCSQASVGELARLLVQDRQLGQVLALFISPAGTATNWARTELWQQAARIPGVTVALDQAGVEARRFGVTTSGETLLYAATGELLFQGGITLSRGHSGDNPSRTALENLLAHQASTAVLTPTFGCPLFTADGGKERVSCNP